MRLDRLKVLVVDDNKHTRQMLAQILRALGVHQIYEAGDGAEGLQALRSHAADIVLTDLAMEPLGGIEFVRLLRTAPESPNPLIPIIMITGHSTMKAIRDARDAGVNEFMAKPITARGVIERLVQVVDHARHFVRAGDYFGPDRRRRVDPKHEGPWRRVGDSDNVRALEI